MLANTNATAAHPTAGQINCDQGQCNLQLVSAEQQRRSEVDQPDATQGELAGKLAGVNGEIGVKRCGDHTKQEIAAEHIKCANSFDPLVVKQDYGENDNRTKLELVCGDTVSHRGKTSSPGNTKQQQNYIHVDARANEQATGILTIPGGHDAPSELLELGAKYSSDEGVEKGLKQQTTLGSSNTPTLHFSSPHVEKIIKDVQAAMVLNNTMVKQPLVTLNTSVYDVPS